MFVIHELVVSLGCHVDLNGLPFIVTNALPYNKRPYHIIKPSWGEKEEPPSCQRMSRETSRSQEHSIGAPLEG